MRSPRIRLAVLMTTAAVITALMAKATTVPRLTFEELTDKSELVVSGDVIRTWSDWDTDHSMIWTHSELKVTSMLKGGAVKTVVVSEPGGRVGLQVMTIAGTPFYAAGDKVVLFLSRMPNGLFRTTGWGQGKYVIDGNGRLHGDNSVGSVELVSGDRGLAGLPLGTLNGITVTDLAGRVAARVRAVSARSAGAAQ